MLVFNFCHAVHVSGTVYDIIAIKSYSRTIPISGKSCASLDDSPLRLPYGTQTSLVCAPAQPL